MMTPYNIYSPNQNCVWPSPNYPYGDYYPQTWQCSRCGKWMSHNTWHDCTQITYTNTWKQTPHKCPVCDGRQTVASGFYGDRVGVLIGSGQRETCRTCSGLGMIWA